MMRIEDLTSDAAINRLVPEWQALWQRVSSATPFQSPEWLLSWWSFFGNGAPLVLTAREDGRLIGVLPLYRHDEPECCKLLPMGIALSDYLDALMEPDRCGLAAALLGSLVGLPRWEECYLPDLPPRAALLAAQCPAQLIEYRGTGETCPVLALPSAVAELRKVVPRKTLRDLRQARRRAAAGGVEAIRADASIVSEFMQDFFRLHESRWQPIAGHGVCADPVVRDFHLTAAQRMLNAGMLRLYLLRVGNSTAAAYYGFTAKRSAYAYLSGFDPEFAELSPGTQIVAHAIEEAVREGAQEFHFLRGGETYKYAWGAVDRPNTTLSLRRKAVMADLITECPPSLRAPLTRYLAGEVSGQITLMHFALQFGDADSLGSLLAILAGAAPQHQELADLLRLAKANMDHLAQVTALAKDGLVNIPSDDSDAVAAIREQFDRAVAVAPEASVALYSLGSADILDRATTEIVTNLAQWGLLRPDANVLDIGCGIGRIERALAPLVDTITAIDISTGMIEEARRRCRDLANVAFQQCGGRDLAGLRDRSFDLVLAVDSFPYLFAADPEIVARHLRDAARVLRPGGAVVILNFSYRGDEEADRQDIGRLAGVNGFTIRRAGTRDFILWDGLTFLLTLPAHRE